MMLLIGCIFLKKIYIHPGVTTIGNRAFDGLHFNYLYSIKDTSELVLTDELPQEMENIKEIIELDKFTKSLSNFDYGLVLQRDKWKQMSELAEILNKNKFSIPSIYGKELIENNLDKQFYKNSDFRFFRSEFKDINKILQDYPEEERLDFYKFANALGCFSKEKIREKNGKETEAILGQKASSLLSNILKTDGMKLGQYHGLFDSLPFETETNQEFLKFISQKGKNKFENLDLLIMLESEYPGMFVKVMCNFKEASSFRDCLDEYGKPVKISWEEALKKYYLSQKYVGVTKENSDIAETFGGKGLSQETFDEAVELRRQAKIKGVSEHILGENLREETILESIERIRKQTGIELLSCKQTMNELYDKQFTYEWLSKNDPKNSIMGLFCSCCGSITSQAYGKNIAKASVIAEDVQNLVIKDSKGNIISKGTFYLNKDRGYGVINDFELNNHYRNHEHISFSGRYNVAEESKEEQERELIFKAFQRGVQAFVQKYNVKNPQKPINQINVGAGYNRLKKQIERFKKATNNLTVPSEYSFLDAEKEQYILYEAEKQEKEDYAK